jgi:long-chain acyl-CoA synthetase
MLLDAILDMQTHRTPDAPAVIIQDRVVTYEQVQARVRRLTAALAASVDPGDRVGILAGNCLEYVDALYGAPRASMLLAMLNQRLHPSEWAAICRDAHVRLLLVGAEYVTALLSVRDEIPSLELIVVLGDAATETDESIVSYDDFLARGDASHVPSAPRSPEDVAWVVYTSGTTGSPKGVMHSHRSLTAGIMTTIVAYGARMGDRVYFSMPLCHVGAVGVMMTHLQGGRFIVAPSFEPATWLRDVREQGVTSVTLMPTMMRMIFDCPDFADADLSSLKHVGFGGPMPVGLLREALDHFGPILASGFGMTEFPGTLCAFTKEMVIRAAADEPELLLSCGTPVMLLDFRVVDDENRDCPVGEVGEIVLHGDNRFVGYLNNPEAEQAASAGGMFRTGDMAYRDDEGFVFLVDRRKDMIRSGGENVYSVEVERVLQAHPDVAEVAVVGVSDPLWIETVAAVVVLKPGAAMTPDDVIAWCRQHLAGYKCPRIVEFMDSLPRGSLAKVAKRQLRDQLEANGRAAPAAAEGRPASPVSCSAPPASR